MHWSGFCPTSLRQKIAIYFIPFSSGCFIRRMTQVVIFHIDLTLIVAMATLFSAKIEKMLYWTTAWCVFFMKSMKPGIKARPVAMSLGNQEALRSILASSTSVREALVMKLFLRPFFLLR